MSKMSVMTTDRWARVSEYFQWLCESVLVDKEDTSYWILMKDLFKKEFFSLVPNDDNREFDGKKLREVYFGDCYEDYLNSPCSVLELMIGLAGRIQFIMDKPDEDSHISRWFWMMIDNLGLEKYEDSEFYFLGRDPHGMIDRVLNKFLDRRYTMKGKGGLFPVTQNKQDQRKVELWYQMSTYLNENFFME